jgi:hypothetical protein
MPADVADVADKKFKPGICIQVKKSPPEKFREGDALSQISLNPLLNNHPACSQHFFTKSIS